MKQFQLVFFMNLLIALELTKKKQNTIKLFYFIINLLRAMHEVLRQNKSQTKEKVMKCNSFDKSNNTEYLTKNALLNNSSIGD